MNAVVEFICQPWPWYIAGPLIGLTVPILLIFGNKAFGISSSFRHICAACIPSGIPFFQYNWRKEAWNLFFAAGILIGGFVAGFFLADPVGVKVAASTTADLENMGVTVDNQLMPGQIFNWDNVLSPVGLIFFVLGGLMVGFGTRWAGGCTSGHAIMGLSNLQWPSLVATCCFMAGGFFMTWIVFPYLFKWIGF